MHRLGHSCCSFKNSFWIKLSKIKAIGVVEGTEFIFSFFRDSYSKVNLQTTLRLYHAQSTRKQFRLWAHQFFPFHRHLFFFFSKSFSTTNWGQNLGFGLSGDYNQESNTNYLVFKNRVILVSDILVWYIQHILKTALKFKKLNFSLVSMKQ